LARKRVIATRVGISRILLLPRLWAFLLLVARLVRAQIVPRYAVLCHFEAVDNASALKFGPPILFASRYVMLCHFEAVDNASAD
jgi:hypothetical protein